MTNKMNEKRKNEIKRWWDNPRNIRWDKFYETNDSNSFYAEKRLEKTLHVLDSIKRKNLNVLELGCGAGQSSEKILNKGFRYTGIDISDQLINCAKKRCNDYLESGVAQFFVKSVDDQLPIKDNSQDVVLIIGMLQYVDDMDYCFKEIRRVLKADGHILICQTNMYHIIDFFSLRSLLVRLSYLFMNQEYEISSSFKSILLETNLKKIFNLDNNSSIMKYKFIKEGYIERKYNFQKKLMSLSRLSKILEKYKFYPKVKTGTPFFYSDRFFLKSLAGIFNLIFNLFLLIPIFSLVKNVANNVIILGKIKSP